MAASTRTRVGVSIAMALVVAGVVTSSSLPASGEATLSGTPVDAKIGTLAVNLSASGNPRSGSVVFTPAALQLPGVPTLTQAIITEQPCSLSGVKFGPITAGEDVVDAEKRLLDIDGYLVTSTGLNPAVIQLNQLGLGVNAAGSNCGDPAGVIGRGEQMTLALGDYLENPGIYFKRADVQIRRSGSGGNLRVSFDDSNFTTIDVPSVTPAAVTVARGVQELPFEKVALRSTTTSGGSAGLAVETTTTFDVWGPSNIDFEVDCSEPVVQSTGGDVAETVTFLRGENLVKPGPEPGPGPEPESEPESEPEPEECGTIDVTVAIVNDPGAEDEVTDYVFWNNGNEANASLAVAATLTIEWAAIEPSRAGNPTQVDYDGDGPGGFVDAPWCLAFFSETDTDGKVSYEGSVLPPYTGPGANLDETAPWCLVSSDQELRGDEVFRTDVFFGSGDPKAALK
jgi:hypothetical protein